LGQTHGIEIGDQVLAIDGVPVHDYAQRELVPFQSAATEPYLMSRVARDLFRGARNVPVHATFSKPSGRQLDCRLSRVPSTDPMSYHSVFAEEPLVTPRAIGDGIGYIAVRSFGREEVVRQFTDALKGLGSISALILDLRINGGGNSCWSDQIISKLLSAPIDGMIERRLLYSPALRSWHMGDNGSGVLWEEHVMDPLEPADGEQFTGRLILLVSAATHSAAEDFVGPLKASGRATVVGTATAGSTGNPLPYRLPGGGGGRVCTRYMLLPDRTEFIGTGIAPDVHAEMAPADIVTGRDPVLETALSITS
jgi:C-terminal processing protease CtpA/Prc